MATINPQQFFGGNVPPAPSPAVIHTPDGPKPRSTIADLAIGFAKGIGSTVKGLGDTAAAAAPSILAGPVASAIPAVRDAIAAPINKVKTAEQNALGLTDEKLAADNITQGVGKGAEFASELLGPAAISKVAKIPALIKSITGAEALLPAVKEGASIEEVARLADAKKEVQSASDALMEGKADPAALKAATDKTAAQPTFREKLAGLAPDVKARIKGKGKLLADYLNIADARNQSDLVPTPLEYAASFADHAVGKMEELLSDTGSKIGAFRQKISTYPASRDEFNQIRQTFQTGLARLNLTVKNGEISKIPGKIAQTVSDAEIKGLQGLHDDLEIASENPSLENLIDLRNKFTNKINFDKAARDVSNTLDPLSRTVRQKVADIGAKIVGKSEAKNLDEYSRFMDAYNDLRGYTDRKAGGEFLLKRVFSERGGDPRAVMQTILQHTGIDLMDHAMMAKIATELGGNPATMGLFRQEITKAGLDAVNLMQGKPVGAVTTLFQKALDKAVDARKVFQKAAK